MMPIRIHRLVFVSILVAFISLAQSWVETVYSADPANRITVIYLSDKGTKITVTFDIADESVELRLPDSRQVKLSRAISASGVRFTDGKETFWEHHGEGAYWVGEKLIFHGKAQE